MEIFRVLSDYPDYFIGNKGTIKSIKTGKVVTLKGKVDKDGYIEYHLRDKNNKSVHRRGHRLVMFAFKPNFEGLPEVNHINGIKNDNRVENLEWVNTRQNTIHSFTHLGRVASRGNGIKVDLVNIDDGSIITFDYIVDVADFLKCSITNVHTNYVRNKNNIFTKKGKRYLIYKKYYVVPHDDKSVETIEKGI